MREVELSQWSEPGYKLWRSPHSQHVKGTPHFFVWGLTDAEVVQSMIKNDKSQAVEHLRSGQHQWMVTRLACMHLRWRDKRGRVLILPMTLWRWVSEWGVISRFSCWYHTWPDEPCLDIQQSIKWARANSILWDKNRDRKHTCAALLLLQDVGAQSSTCVTTIIVELIQALSFRVVLEIWWLESWRAYHELSLYQCINILMALESLARNLAKASYIYATMSSMFI